MEKILNMLSSVTKYPMWVFRNNKLLYTSDEFEREFGVSIHNFNEELKSIMNQTLENNSLEKKFIYKDKQYNYKAISDEICTNEYTIGIFEKISIEISPDDNYMYILNTIIENIPEIVFYKDINGKYKAANKHCLDFFKTRGIYDIIGKTDQELATNKEFVNNCIKNDQTVIETKKTLYIEEKVPGLHDDIEFVETIKTPVLNDKQEVCGIVGLVRDITLSKRRIEELKKIGQVDKLTGLYNRRYFDNMIKILDKEENYPLGLIVGDVDGLKVTNDAFGHIMGDKLLVEISDIIKSSCKSDDLIFRLGGDEIAIIVCKSTEEYILNLKKQILNKCEQAPANPIPLSISLGSGTKNNKNQNIEDIIKYAEKELYKKKLEGQTKICYGEFAISFIVEAINNNLCSRVIDIEEHIENTTKYSKMIGECLLFSKEQLSELTISSMLHDIGLAAIEDEYLGKYTFEIDRDNIKVMSDHSEKGYRIVKSYSNLENVASTILNHHENWDGTGYPFGIAGEEIPLNSRIIHIASDFDIILRKNKSENLLNYKEESIKEILEGKGKSYQPELVDILYKNFS